MPPRMQRPGADQSTQSRGHAATVGSVGGRCQTASEKPSHPQYHPHQYLHHGVRQRRTFHGALDLQSHHQTIRKSHQSGWEHSLDWSMVRGNGTRKRNTPPKKTTSSWPSTWKRSHSGDVSLPATRLWGKNRRNLAFRRFQRRSTDRFGKRQSSGK